MTTHAPTVAFSGIDCFDIDVQVAAAGGHNPLMFGPITPFKLGGRYGWAA